MWVLSSSLTNLSKSWKIPLRWRDLSMPLIIDLVIQRYTIKDEKKNHSRFAPTSRQSIPSRVGRRDDDPVYPRVLAPLKNEKNVFTYLTYSKCCIK